ncbi:hypothetical protein D3C86_1565910 [compost metagenome]
MADEPVADDADRHADADAPDHEAPAAHQPQQARDRRLLPHPGVLQKTVEGIASDPTQIEGRRLIQHQSAIHLPDGVDRHGASMRQVVVTVGLTLRPVTQVVGADHPEGTAHAHQRSDPDQQPFQPQGTVEAAVDQPPVKPNRMAEQQGGARQDDENGECAQAEGHKSKCQGDRQHGAVPH